MRFLHLIVVVALVSAAVYVYKVKFASTLQAERVAKLRADVRHERDAIASLRAEWSQLDNPSRIQGLADRHLKLKPIDASQLDSLDHLPERTAGQAPDADPIGAIIDMAAPDYPTGSIKTPAVAR
jgi:cell division protein FtsL